MDINVREDRGAGRPPAKVGILAAVEEMQGVEAAEKVEFRATLPGEYGPECVFYELIGYKIAHLREEVYIVWIIEGEEYHPDPELSEHSPVRPLEKRQKAEGVHKRVGTVVVDFVCYAPEGSDAADRAAAEILDALDRSIPVVEWSDKKRSMFGKRYRARRLRAVVDGGEPYRPHPSLLEEELSSIEPPADSPLSRRNAAINHVVGVMHDEGGLVNVWRRLAGEIRLKEWMETEDLGA